MSKVRNIEISSHEAVFLSALLSGFSGLSYEAACDSGAGLVELLPSEVTADRQLLVTDFFNVTMVISKFNDHSSNAFESMAQELLVKLS